MSQKAAVVAVVGYISGVIFHSTCIGVLYFGLDLGYTGIVWSTGMVFVGRFIGVQTFVRCRKDFKYFDDVQLFSRETVSNLGPMIKISLLAMLMGIWGWWAFEILTFMAMGLGT